VNARKEGCHSKDLEGPISYKVPPNGKAFSDASTIKLSESESSRRPVVEKARIARDKVRDKIRDKDPLPRLSILLAGFPSSFLKCIMRAVA
jgi:hypothetical protein